MEKENLLISIIEQQKINELKDFVKENKDFQFNFTTSAGKNLLHFAASKLSSNTLGIIQILLLKGLDPLALDEKFKSSLDIAKESSNIPAMTIMKHFVNLKNKESQTYI
ncbi:hypothetical protein GW796_06950 [archaeon]|nr:hypothetical protein [archaeon]